MNTVRFIFQLIDGITAPARGAVAAVNRIQRAANLARSSLNLMGRGLAISGAGFALATPIIAATRAAADFQQQMQGISSISNMSVRDTNALADNLLRMSNRLPLTAAQLTDITREAELFGVKGVSSLTKYTDTIAKLSIATRKNNMGLSTGTLSEDLAKFLNETGSTARTFNKDLSETANVLLAVDANTASSIPQVLNLSKFMAAGSVTLGLSRNEIVAISGALSGLGANAEAGGSAVIRVLMKMGGAARHGGAQMELYSKVLGVSSTEFKNLMTHNPAGALLKLADGLRAAHDRGVNVNYMLDAMGIKNVRDIRLVDQLTIGNTVLATSLRAAAEAAGQKGLLDDRAARATNNFNDQSARLRNTLHNIGILIGTTVLPPLQILASSVQQVLNVVFNWTQAHPNLTRVLVLSTAAVSALLIALGGTAMAVGGARAAYSQLLWILGVVQGRMVAARASAIALQAALMFRVTGGVATAGQAALMTSAFGRLRIVLTGVRLAFLTGARAAGVFALSLLTNPITWLVLAIVGIGAAFVWAWRSSEAFRNGVIAALQPVRVAWDQLVQAVLNLWSAFLALIGPIGTWFNSIGVKINAMGKGWSGVVEAMAYGIGYFFGIVIPIFSAIVARATYMLTQVVNLVTGIVQLVQGIIKGNADAVMIALGNIAAAVDNFFANIFSKLGNWVAGAFQSGLDWVLNLWNGIQSWIGNIGNNIRNFFSNIWDGIKNLFGQGIQTSVSVQTNIPGAVSSGQQVSAGLAQGITQNMAAPKAAALNMTGTVLDTANNAFQIKSPSRVFARMGGFLMSGLAQGIDRSSRQAVSAVSRATRAVSGAANLRSAARGAVIGVTAAALGGTFGSSAGAKVAPVITLTQNFEVSGAGNARDTAEEIKRISTEGLLEVFERLALEGTA